VQLSNQLTHKFCTQLAVLLLAAYITQLKLFIYYHALTFYQVLLVANALPLLPPISLGKSKLFSALAEKK